MSRVTKGQALMMRIIDKGREENRFSIGAGAYQARESAKEEEDSSLLFGRTSGEDDDSSE